MIYRGRKLLKQKKRKSSVHMNQRQPLLNLLINKLNHLHSQTFKQNQLEDMIQNQTFLNSNQLLLDMDNLQPQILLKPHLLQVNLAKNLVDLNHLPILLSEKLTLLNLILPFLNNPLLHSILVPLLLNKTNGINQAQIQTHSHTLSQLHHNKQTTTANSIH